MNANCIVTTSKEFKALLKETGLKTDVLDQLCYNYLLIKGKIGLPTATEVKTMLEIDSIKQQAIKDGTYIITPDGLEFCKAPNGKMSNLTPQLWLTVRTTAFKKWFGDWENNPSEASKVVDENGEPLVVYHGSRSDKPFNTFLGITYFSSNRFYANQFLYPDSIDIFEVFLNIRNPKNSQEISHNTTYWAFKDANIDGLIGKDKRSEEWEKDFISNYGKHSEFVIRYSNQIKSATNNLLFGTLINNIYKENEDRVVNPLNDLRLITIRNKAVEENKEVTINNLLPILEQSQYKDILEILRKLSWGKEKKELGAVKVKLVSPYDYFSRAEFIRKLFLGKRAFYDASTNTIVINIDSLFTNGDSASVIMHEIMHAITVNRIINNEQLKKEFLTIFDLYKEKFPGQYIREHLIEEFIADIWSNPTTIENLKRTNSKEDSKVSLWDRIKNFFKTKIFSGIRSNSLFALASNTLIELLELETTGISTDMFFEGEQKPEPTTTIEDEVTYEVTEIQPISPLSKHSYVVATRGEEQVDNEVLLKSIDRKLHLGDTISVVTSTNIEEALQIMLVLLTDNRFSPSEKTVTINVEESIYNIAKEYPGIRTKKVGEQYLMIIPDHFTYGLSETLIELSKQYLALKDGIKKPTTLRACSKLAMFALSDLISKLQSGEEVIRDTTTNNIIKVEGLSRIELIKKVSLKRLLEEIKDTYFSDWSDKLLIREENAVIRNNWEAFCELGFQELALLENILLNLTVLLDDERLSREIFDDEEALDVQERVGSVIEAWLIGFRQLSAFSSLSQMLKQYLHTLYLRNSSIDMTEAQKKAGIDIVTDDRGFNIPVNATEAVASILKWTRYSTSLEEMITKLLNLSKLHPWIQPVIDKLKSNDEVFKAQFFTNFCKYFLLYTIITKKDNKLVTKAINENEYADREIDKLKLGQELPEDRLLFILEKDGSINTTILEQLKQYASSQTEPILEETEKALRLLNIDFPTDLLVMNLLMDSKTTKDLKTRILYITLSMDNWIKAGNKAGYKPLTENNSNYLNIINLFKQVYGEGVESVSYSDGKLYYSYVVPSYLNILVGKLKGNVANYEQFIQQEYGQFSWFKNSTGWRNEWLRQLLNDTKVREQLEHTVVLTKDGVSYVDKNSPEYAASILSMYFYAPQSDYAWFRMPMMSNKPSEEYLKFRKFKADAVTGRFDKILNCLVDDVFNQELDRMKMGVERKGISKQLQVKGFDKNLSRFVFLDFLNNVEDLEFKRLVKKSTTEQLTAEEKSKLYTLAKQYIEEGINQRFANFVTKLVNNGLLELDEKGNYSMADLTLKLLPQFGSHKLILTSLEEFYWNDMFANINILELTITDPAYYKDSDDLQKRLALLHAPSMRPYILVLDPKTNKLVSDGKYRTIYIVDKVFKSTILANLKQANKQILESITDPIEKLYMTKFLSSVLDAFEKVNFADALAFLSPTALRKKLLMFGKWTDVMEKAYNRILSGKLSENDLEVLWTPLKPFVYGCEVTESHTSFGKMRMPVQNKNSEYTIILADAILKKAGIANRLLAIYEFMEETQRTDNGVDSIQFESTVKSGLTGIVDINLDAIEAYKKQHKEWVDELGITDLTELDTRVVKQILTDAAFNKGDLYTVVNGRTVLNYNTNIVHELPFENYGILLEVPSHFRHSQLWGSQLRMLIGSDIPEVSTIGEPNTVIIDNKEVTVADAKKEFEELTVANIEDSADLLVQELHLDTYNRGLQKIAISNLLKQRILEDGRYGTDELWAVSINPETENFNIPLGDPIHADMIEKLLNSVIKNRICKLQMPGGPVVQVTNYGCSDEVSIRYASRDNKILLTQAEWEALKADKKELIKSRVLDKLDLYETDITMSSYNDYIEKYLYRPAYYECYAPIFSEEFYKKYSNPVTGEVNIDLVEKYEPKLLEMIGYRIPTEMKYSMAPLRIVGFLPINSEGIMLPAEWTTLSGSDKRSVIVSTTII